MKVLAVFLAGVISTISIAAAVLAWHIYSTRPGQIDGAVCALHYEIEKLKRQNREDVATSKRQFERNLRLLGIKDTPALDRAQAAAWAHELKENAPTVCPFH